MWEAMPDEGLDVEKELDGITRLMNGERLVLNFVRRDATGRPDYHNGLLAVIYVGCAATILCVWKACV
jgi:hypothetical protein